MKYAVTQFRHSPGTKKKEPIGGVSVTGRRLRTELEDGASCTTAEFLLTTSFYSSLISPSPWIKHKPQPCTFCAKQKLSFYTEYNKSVQATILNCHTWVKASEIMSSIKNQHFDNKKLEQKTLLHIVSLWFLDQKWNYRASCEEARSFCCMSQGKNWQLHQISLKCHQYEHCQTDFLNTLYCISLCCVVLHLLICTIKGYLL